MWHYEHAVETGVDRDALWRTWVDVSSWPDWNAGVVRVEVDGPFAVGTTFRMVPPDDTRVVYRTTITGPAADDLGPTLGPAITADFPEVVDGLIRAAAR